MESTEKKEVEENQLKQEKTEPQEKQENLENQEKQKNQENQDNQENHENQEKQGKAIITPEKLEILKKEYESKPLNHIMENILTSNKITKIVKVNDRKVYNQSNFEISIPTMKAVNQGSTGRCWIFAGLNVLRGIVAKKLNVDNFELSQNYIAFYDKLEKINYTLENIIELCDKDYDDRTLSHILKEGIQDGGQWDMFANIVRKYGVVPKTVMDETTQSSATKESNFIISLTLRKFAAQASKLIREGKIAEIKELKENIFKKLYNLLCISFGRPVEKFDYEYTDKTRTYHLEKGLTPLSFYSKYLEGEIDKYVSVVNAPTSSKPFYSLFTIKYVGNVVGGEIIKYVNLPMNELKELCIKMLKNKDVVWFGSDCGKYKDEFIWDDKMFDYKTIFDIDLAVDKADMLDYRISAMDHAMVINGVSFIEEGKPGKWKIENSWGADKNGGTYLMSDSWFEKFVYQAVIKKEYLSKEQLDVLAKEPIKLEPWDPMGTLAD